MELKHSGRVDLMVCFDDDDGHDAAEKMEVIL